MARWRVAMMTGGLCVALVAAGCSRGGGSSSGASATTAPAGPADTRGGDFGSLKAVCGPGSAKGATAQGVTDTGIDVGTMADPGATVSPGLNQEIFDSASAFVTWCNNAGGILGRKINLHLHDAKIFEVAARMLDACNTDFALAGNGEAFDDAGVDQRVKCGLPELPAFDTSAKATGAPLKVQADSLPLNEDQVYLWRGAQHISPGATKVGFLTGNLAAIVVRKDRAKEAATKSGLTSVYDENFPVTGVDNPQSYVQRMKDAGVQILTILGDVPSVVALEKAMQTANFYPAAIVLQGNAYDNLLVKNAGAALNNTWVLSQYVPFEAAAQNPPTQAYLDIMKTDKPGGKIAALGLNAWDAWLLFATAARDCGSGLTRACLLQQAGSHPTWDSGGLKAPNDTNAVTQHEAECYLALKATAAGFQIDATFLPPNKGLFNCDPANVVTLTGDYRPKA